MMSLRPRPFHILVLLSLLLSGQVLAKDLSLDEAVERARQHEGGRVISAQTQESNGQRVYNIRLLTKDGKVKRIRIDGQSGRRMPGRER